MLKVYPAIVHLEDGQYWLEFPDLPGCQTCAGTLEEAVACAAESMGLYLSSKMENGAALPEPSDIRSIDALDGFTTLIYTDPSGYARHV